MVAMATLSGTAGPISINCGQTKAKPVNFMPVQRGRQAAEACMMERIRERGEEQKRMRRKAVGSGPERDQ